MRWNIFCKKRDRKKDKHVTDEHESEDEVATCWAVSLLWKKRSEKEEKHEGIEGDLGPIATEGHAAHACGDIESDRIENGKLLAL